MDVVNFGNKTKPLIQSEE